MFVCASIGIIKGLLLQTLTLLKFLLKYFNI